MFGAHRCSQAAWRHRCCGRCGLLDTPAQPPRGPSEMRGSSVRAWCPCRCGQLPPASQRCAAGLPHTWAPGSGMAAPSHPRHHTCNIKARRRKGWLREHEVPVQRLSAPGALAGRHQLLRDKQLACVSQWTCPKHAHRMTCWVLMAGKRLCLHNIDNEWHSCCPTRTPRGEGTS